MDAALPVALVLAHASGYGVFGDDAFISLRYADHLARWGELVYNPGERVEGFTSPLWVLLTALLLRLGVAPVAAVQGLGAGAAIGLVGATLALGRRLGLGRWGSVIAAVWVACSAPVAGWALAGLETPLFAALVTWGVALGIEGAKSRGGAAGAVLGLATLARPEGALVFGSVAAGVAWRRLRARSSEGEAGIGLGRWLMGLAASFAVPVLSYQVFRMAYYGEVLPNTFYVKTSGARWAAVEQGLAYARVALPQVGVLALGLVVPALPWRRGAAEDDHGWSRALGVGRLLVPLYVGYVVSVGGDFLDLARFLVPLVPLAACWLVGALGRGLRGARPVVWVTWGALTLVHGLTQYRVGARALALNDAEKATVGIEPFGWTGLYARRWAATGRWLAQHAGPGDTMAVGAAGAMPFYAGLSNLDTFGLCDRYVARHGMVGGVRPGHQRWAPREYVLGRRPTFIFIGDRLTEQPIALPRTRPFGAEYVWVQAVVRPERHGAPAPFFHTLLVRRDRAASLRGSRDVRGVGR